MVILRHLLGHFKLGEVRGTGKTVAESETILLSLAAFEADISVVVGDEGQFAQRLVQQNGAVFTVAVVQAVGSIDSTVPEGVDGLVQSPGAADSVVGTIGSGVLFTIGQQAGVGAVGSNQDSVDTESGSKGLDVLTGVGAEDVEDGEALSNLGKVDTRAEWGLVGQFADTSAAWVALAGAGAAGAAADGGIEGAGAGEAAFRAAFRSARAAASPRAGARAEGAGAGFAGGF